MTDIPRATARNIVQPHRDVVALLRAAVNSDVDAAMQVLTLPVEYGKDHLFLSLSEAVVDAFEADPAARTTRRIRGGHRRQPHTPRRHPTPRGRR